MTLRSAETQLEAWKPGQDKRPISRKVLLQPGQMVSIRLPACCTFVLSVFSVWTQTCLINVNTLRNELYAALREAAGKPQLDRVLKLCSCEIAFGRVVRALLIVHHFELRLCLCCIGTHCHHSRGMESIMHTCVRVWRTA